MTLNEDEATTGITDVVECQRPKEWKANAQDGRQMRHSREEDNYKTEQQIARQDALSAFSSERMTQWNARSLTR